MHGNRYGRFIDDGRAFRIEDWRTPMPWCNVVCNGRYGFVISQSGGGFSWLDHCQFNVITRWDMDLARDERGRYLLLSDLDQPAEKRDVWSLAPQPCQPAYDEFSCEHAMGATTFRSLIHGIRASWTLAAAPDDTAEVWSVTLTNESDRTRRLRVCSFFEWCCGVAPDVKREFHRLFFTTQHDPLRHAVMASKNMWEAPFKVEAHWNRPWPHTAALSMTEDDGTTERGFAIGDKTEFLGRYGSQARPHAMLLDELSSSAGFGRSGDPVAALGRDLRLEPDQSVTIGYTLGVQDDRESLDALIEKYRTPASIQLAQTEAVQRWHARFEPTRVRTEATDFDLLNNHWLRYQAISARMWGRTGYYQQSGAFGYRDQLQDSHVWLPIEPDRCREQIMLHAAHQFEDGSVYHWWNPITETGLISACSDDYLWLPMLTASYIRETGRHDILDEAAPFVDDEQAAPLLDHCLRSFRRSFHRQTDRGLPLIGDNDWNDGLSALGDETSGESVWLAIFLFGLLNDWVQILKTKGLNDIALDFRNRAADMQRAVNDTSWDGSWYRRATDKCGRWLGSRDNDAGQIFLNPQTWAILTGLAPEERAQAVWESVRDRLITDYGPLLLEPAYTEPDADVGYITRYAPGARENGGVYMHAATWALAAAAKRRDVEAVGRIWDSIAPPLRAEPDPDGYAAEPYVLPGNVDGPLSPTPGRSGWTWYTGSAAWLNRVSGEWLLGVRPIWEGLRIDPCPPSKLGRVSFTRMWRGHRLVVEFDAREYDPLARTVVHLDGRRLEGNTIRQADLAPGTDATVRVTWVPVDTQVMVSEQELAARPAERSNP